MPISSTNPMLCHLLESSHREDSNKWSNIVFDKKITHVMSIEVHFSRLIWSPGYIAYEQTGYGSDTETRRLIRIQTLCN